VAMKEREIAMASKLEACGSNGSLPSVSSSHKMIAAQPVNPAFPTMLCQEPRCRQYATGMLQKE